MVGIFYQIGTEVFTEGAGSIFTSLLTGTVWIIIGLFLISIIFSLAIWIRWKRKFDIMVEIISERSDGNNVYYFDKGAILTDKETKHKYFRLLTTKVDLPVPPYNVIQNFGKKDLLRIWRKSEEEFVFLLPGIINKEYIVKQDGRVYPLAQEEYKQVEGDISYWNVKRKKQNKGLFDTDSLLMKLLPWLPHLMTGAITIFILYILFDSLPGLINQLSELAKSLTELKAQSPNVIQ